MSEEGEQASSLRCESSQSPLLPEKESDVPSEDQGLEEASPAGLGGSVAFVLQVGSQLTDISDPLCLFPGDAWESWVQGPRTAGPVIPSREAQLVNGTRREVLPLRVALLIEWVTKLF